jgi:hypothetical protein
MPYTGMRLSPLWLSFLRDRNQQVNMTALMCLVLSTSNNKAKHRNVCLKINYPFMSLSNDVPV